MASIRKRNGKYQITVSLGRDSKDRQIRKMTTYKPKATTPKAIEKEVKSFADEFETRVRKGETFNGEKMTLNDFSEYWISNKLNRSSLRESTKHERLMHLKNKILPQIGYMKLTDIKTIHLDKILYREIDAGLSVASAKKLVVTLNSIFKFAYKKSIIASNPVDNCDIPKDNKIKKKRVQFWTEEQARRFLDFLDKPYIVNYSKRTRKNSEGKSYQVKGYSLEKYISPMYKAFFSVAIFVGSRRGENCALKWEDVDFEKMNISIYKAVSRTYNEKGQVIDDPKNESSIRDVAVSTKCLSNLLVWREKEKELASKLGTAWKGTLGDKFDENFIFIKQKDGTQINVDTPTKKFKELVKLYNESVTDEKLKLPEIKLHELRHTSATLLLANNVDVKTVSQRLGHANASTTLNVYTHTLESSDEKAAEILDNII